MTQQRTLVEPESRSLAEVNALDSVMLGGTVSLWLEGRICLLVKKIELLRSGFP